MQNGKVILVVIALVLLGLLAIPLANSFGEQIARAEPEQLTAQAEMLRAEAEKAQAKASEWEALRGVVESMPDAVASTGVSVVQLGYGLAIVAGALGILGVFLALAFVISVNGLSNAAISYKNDGYQPENLLERGVLPSRVYAPEDSVASKHLRGRGVNVIPSTTSAPSGNGGPKGRSPGSPTRGATGLRSRGRTGDTPIRKTRKGSGGISKSNANSDSDSRLDTIREKLGEAKDRILGGGE